MIFFNDIQEDHQSVNDCTESRPNIHAPLLNPTSPHITAVPANSRVDSKELITIQRDTKARTHAKEKEIKQPIPKKIIFSLLFQLLFVGVSYVCPLIPHTDIYINGESRFRIDWSSFVLYFLMVMMGFFYVSIITCDRGREFLKDRKKSYKSIILIHIVTPFLFFTAPALCIASHEQRETYTSKFTLEHLFSSTLPSLEHLFIPFYNYVFYFLPFLLGLNFTILDSFPMLSKCGGKCNRGKWCSFRWQELIVVVYACGLLGGLTGLHLFMLYKDHLLIGYLVAYGTMCLLILLLTFVLRENWVFDPHHYFIAMAFIPLTRFFNPISTAFSGVALGVCVEGAGRWGFEFLWTTKRDRELADWFRSVQNRPVV